MKPKHSLSLLFITIVFLTACTLIGSPKLERPRPPLKFAYSPWVGYFPTAIAQEKGFFTAQGVKVQTFYLEADEPQLANLVAGKYDGMTAPLGNVVSVGANHLNLRVVLKIDQSDGADVVVAQPQIQSVLDLKGKKIGVDLGKFGELFVTRMLETSGLSTAQVTPIKANEQQVVTRLQTNEIQAGHTWEPFASKAVKSGARVLFTSKQTPGLIPDVIVFREQVLRDRPADIRAFVRAWFQAIEYWQSNPKEGNAIIGKVLNIPPATISLEGVKLLTLSDNQQGFTLNNSTDSLYYTAQLYVNFFVRTGGLTRPPDINQLLDPSFLK